MVTTQPSAYSAVSMSVPARMRNGAPRLTMSNAAGVGRQRQPGVRRRTLQVVEVVDQPVQRRSRHSGHVLHAHSHRRARPSAPGWSSRAAASIEPAPIPDERPAADICAILGEVHASRENRSGTSQCAAV